jgi:hypothetical protein
LVSPTDEEEKPAPPPPPPPPPIEEKPKKKKTKEKQSSSKPTTVETNNSAPLLFDFMSDDIHPTNQTNQQQNEQDIFKLAVQSDNLTIVSSVRRVLPIGIDSFQRANRTELFRFEFGSVRLNF